MIYRNNIFWINILFLFGLILGLLILIIGSSISSLLFFIILSIFGVIIALKLGRTETKLFIIIFYCNIFIVLLLYLIYMSRYGNPYTGGGSDDLSYEKFAINFVQSFGVFDYFSIRGNITSYSHNSIGYVYLVSFLYRFSNIFGDFHTLLPRVFNSFLLSILSIYIFRFSYIKLNLKLNTSIIVGLIVGLSPSMMYFSAHTFRDTFIATVTFLIIYLWSNYFSYNYLQRLSLLLITPLLIFVLWEFRNFSAIATCFLILISYYNLNINSIKYDKTKKMLIIFFFIILSGFVLYYLYGVGSINWFINRYGAYQLGYTEYRLDKASGLSKYVFSHSGFLGLFLRLIYLSISPFPVLTLQIDRLWLSMGTILQIFLIPFVIIGLIRLFIEKKELQIPIGFIIMFCGTAILSFQQRYFVIHYPFAAIACGYGYEYYKSKGFKVKYLLLLMYFIFTMGIAAYAFLKMKI